jgi:hypothetical protein
MVTGTEMRHSKCTEQNEKHPQGMITIMMIMMMIMMTTWISECKAIKNYMITGTRMRQRDD